MVGHKAVGIDVTTADVSQQVIGQTVGVHGKELDKLPIIFGFLEDVLAVDTTEHDVVDAGGGYFSRFARHNSTFIKHVSSSTSKSCLFCFFDCHCIKLTFQLNLSAIILLVERQVVYL